MKTERLGIGTEDIERAARLLRDGELVAFPTETVYGLGADARNDLAVAAIFEAKGRPSFNPLIVHVASIDAANEIGQIPDNANQFLSDGWPAGLTLVVPLRASSGLSPLTTAGLPSVGLRVPHSDAARHLLEAFGGPIAAPSANPSGRISPTTAGHVLTGLDGRIAAVVDGGQALSGLESTIIGFDDAGPIVLREGVHAVPDDLRRKTAVTGSTPSPDAPGMMASHYAPRGQLRMNVAAPEPDEWFIGFGEIGGDATLSASGDLREAAARLFALLHEADDKPKIAVAPIPDTGLGRAINDRLRRAAVPRT